MAAGALSRLPHRTGLKSNRIKLEGAQFRRDVKLAQKRGKAVVKLREAILMLIEGSSLPPRYGF